MPKFVFKIKHHEKKIFIIGAILFVFVANGWVTDDAFRTWFDAAFPPALTIFILSALLFKLAQK